MSYSTLFFFLFFKLFDFSLKLFFLIDDFLSIFDNLLKISFSCIQKKVFLFFLKNIELLLST